jgi:hypothetical protein
VETKKQAYKTKYQKEKLKRIYIDVKKEFGEEFDLKLKEYNLSRSDILIPQIQKFLNNPEKFSKEIDK